MKCPDSLSLAACRDWLHQHEEFSPWVGIFTVLAWILVPFVMLWIWYRSSRTPKR